MNLRSLRTITRNRYLVRRLQFHHVLANTKGKQFDAVLDLGGGKSPYRKLIATHTFTSTDIEDRLGTGEVVIADANQKLPFADHSFDLVICTEVLEHLKNPQNALNEMYRILKPDGTVVLTAPLVWEHHEEPHDFFRYTKYGVQILAEHAHFSRITITESNGYWYTLMALLVSRFSSPLFIPFVMAGNILGRIIEKIETRGKLPLGIHAILKP